MGTYNGQGISLIGMRGLILKGLPNEAGHSPNNNLPVVVLRV